MDFKVSGQKTKSSMLYKVCNTQQKDEKQMGSSRCHCFISDLCQRRGKGHFELKQFHQTIKAVFTEESVSLFVFSSD